MKRAAWLLLALVGTSVAPAQVPPRWPRLRAGQDTNDATAYVRLARNLLYSPVDTAHAAAEAALRWAARLDPGSGDPPYLMAVALLRPILRAFWLSRGSRRVLRRELTPELRQRVDSLLREAWLREPFYDIDLEPLLAFGLVPSAKDLRDPIERAYSAYHGGNYQLAADEWGRAMAGAPHRVDLRLRRAHAFYWLKKYDSTAAELRAVLAATARGDSDPPAWAPPDYVVQYALGVAYERGGNADSASEAYRRALVTNLGLYMARVRLSDILLARGDTAKALEEVTIAADISPRDPWLSAYYGYTLIRLGRPDDAVTHLRAAISLDPHYATPYFLLGLAHSVLRRDREATAAFQAFLGRTTRNDDRRRWTAERLAALADSAGPRD